MTRTPLEELRACVRYFGHWSESWNDQWAMHQLIKIYRFAMSEEGSRINEDPTTWNEATLCKALGVPYVSTDADTECTVCRAMYLSDDHPFPVCAACR